jgi:hypothetical protein
MLVTYGGAQLTVCVPSNASIDDQPCKIVDLANAAYRFALVDTSLQQIAMCDNPAVLSAWALSLGAKEVRHDYDLVRYASGR